MQKSPKEIPWLQEPSSSLIDSLVACGLVTPSAKITKKPKPQSNLKELPSSDSLTSSPNKITTPKFVKGGSPSFVTRGGLRASTPGSSIDMAQQKYAASAHIRQQIRAKTPKSDKKILSSSQKISTIDNFTTPAVNPDDNNIIIPSVSTSDFFIESPKRTAYIGDFVGTERKFAGRKEAQELSSNYHCLLQSVNLEDYSNPETLKEGIQKSLDFTLLTLNRLIMQLRGYSEEHAKLLNEIKNFYVRRIEQMPEMSDHYTEELEKMAELLSNEDKNKQHLQNEIDDRENTISNLHLTIAESQRKYEKLNLTLQDTQEKLDTTLLSNAALEDERKSLLFKLSKSEEAKSQAQQTATANQEMLENSRAQIKSQEALLEKYQQEGAGFRPLYLKATDENSKLKDQIDELKDKMVSMVERQVTADAEVQTDPVIIQSINANNQQGMKRSSSKTRNRTGTLKKPPIPQPIELNGGAPSSQHPLRKSNESLPIGNVSQQPSLQQPPLPKKGGNKDPFSKTTQPLLPNGKNVVGSTSFQANNLKSVNMAENLPVSTNLATTQGNFETASMLSNSSMDNDNAAKTSDDDLATVIGSSSKSGKQGKPSLLKFLNINGDENPNNTTIVNTNTHNNNHPMFTNNAVGKGGKQNSLDQFSYTMVYKPPPLGRSSSFLKKGSPSPYNDNNNNYDSEPLPADYTINHKHIETPPTLVGCVYRLLPLSINSTLSNSPSLKIEAIMAQTKTQPREFHWVLHRIIDFFHSLYSVDQLSTTEEDTVLLFRSNLLESCQMEVLANKIFNDIVQSCQFYKLTSSCVQFFLQFLMQEFTIVDFKFFNIIFNLCFEFMYPSISEMIEDPELQPEVPQFLIHVDVVIYLVNLLFPHQAAKFDLDELRKETILTVHYDLVDFFKFATQMILLFRNTHQQFHSQVKNLLTLVGWSQQVDVSEPLFKDFFVIVMPISDESEIDKLWQRFKLEMSMNNEQVTINQSSFIHFCSDFPEVSNDLLSLPYIPNFDRVFSTIPSPLQELMTLLKKRFTKFVREVYLRLPKDLQKNFSNTVLKIRNSLLRCDVSTALISYRHFLQLTDLKLTEMNPFVVFSPNITVSDVQQIVSMLHSRESLAVGSLGSNVVIEHEEPKITGKGSNMNSNENLLEVSDEEEFQNEQQQNKNQNGF